MVNKQVIIYTDGSSRGNPGPGGFGVVLIYGDVVKKMSRGYRLTTNNRMELRAVSFALEALKFPCSVKLYTDSEYVANAINRKWLAGWQKRNWRKSDKTAVKNKDLWQLLVKQLAIHDVEFFWVKGHADNKYNEMCDELAFSAASGEDLPEDVGYEGN